MCAVLVLAGCAATTAGSGRSSSGIGQELADTRRELAEVRREQERLRAMVEYLQYSVQYGDPVEGAFVPGGSEVETTPDSGPDDQRPAGRSVSAIDALGLALAPEGGDGRLRTTQENVHPLVEDTLAMAIEEPGPEPEPVPVASVDDEAAFSRLPRALREELAAAEESAPGLGLGDVPLEVPLRVAKSLRGSGYDDAIRALADSQWDDAIQYFRDFIYRHPNSSWADNAQFWTGEAYLRKGRYSSAIKALNQVVIRYSSGDRAAAALLRLADVFTAIGDPIDAKLSLKKLVRLYPDSPEGIRAAGLLGAQPGDR
jgi:tol-pal system protein YbgF